MKRAVLLASAFAVAVCSSLGVPRSASAFQAQGAKWLQLPVGYRINLATSVELGTSTTENVVKASYAAWSEPACSAYTSNFLGNTTKGLDANDHFNTLIWKYDNWPAEFGGSSVIGITLSVFSSGQMLDADIAFNGVNHDWSTSPTNFNQVDAQSILTHEIGHQLGLGHSQTASATMYFAYPGGTSQRSLESDDVEGVCALYPKTGSECSADGECPGGACVQGWCVEGGSSEGAFGDPCASPEECDSALCVATSDAPEGVCSLSCDDGSDCPGGLPCLALQGGGGACNPNGEAPAQGQTGDPCSSGADCSSGLCVGEPGATAGICTQVCGDESATTCPPGYDCVPIDAGGSACFPGGTATCQDDRTALGSDGTPIDCTPYRCGDAGCLTACSSSEDCSAPAVCNDVGQCVGADDGGEKSGSGGGATTAAADEETTSEPGCLCSTGAGQSRGGLAALLFALAFSLRRRPSVRK